MIGGCQPKLILGYDEDGKFKIDRDQAELIGLTECEPKWILTKPEEPGFQKISAKVTWLEFSDDRTYKKRHKFPKEGLSLLMSPFNDFFTWQTTAVQEIIESRENYWLFRTSNSLYLLRQIEEGDLPQKKKELHERGVA